jgi:putative sterol carrier protein
VKSVQLLGGIALLSLSARALVANEAKSSGSAAHAEVTDASKPADVFRQMSENFHAGKARGVKASYQFLIGGPEGGHWWITVEDGTFKMGMGTVPKPDVTLIASDKDWVHLSTGTLGGTRAFLTGRLKIRGSQALARQLDEMFP